MMPPSNLRRKRAAKKTKEQKIASAIKVLRPLFRELDKAKKEAAELGIFTDERELLTCPKCSLQEDVATTGMLFVTVASDRKHDTGMRFKKIPRRVGYWRCPACKTEFAEQDFGASRSQR